MNIFYVVLFGTLLVGQLVYVEGDAFDVAGLTVPFLQTIIEIAKENHQEVEVHNEGKHDAHIWCASKDNRIGGDEGLWIKPGEKIAWSFGRGYSTEFWCTMDWFGQRVWWTAYVADWKDAPNPNPTKWSIRNDGVYDQLNRKWRDLKS